MTKNALIQIFMLFFKTYPDQLPSHVIFQNIKFAITRNTKVVFT